MNRRLLRARDAMDRAYAEPLDVRAIAAVAHVEAGEIEQSRRSHRGVGSLGSMDIGSRIAQEVPAMAATKASTTRKTLDDKGFTDDEKAAMRERARELKAETKSRDARADGERDLLAKVAEMPPADRVMAERLHALITAAAPDLMPKTWYGMPAYARNGKVVCFFKAASKFETRYATFGFEEEANIDDGAMFPTSFGLKELTAADESKISALVKKAVS